MSELFKARFGTEALPMPRSVGLGFYLVAALLMLLAVKVTLREDWVEDTLA